MTVIDVVHSLGVQKADQSEVEVKLVQSENTQPQRQISLHMFSFGGRQKCGSGHFERIQLEERGLGRQR